MFYFLSPGDALGRLEVSDETWAAYAVAVAGLAAERGGETAADDS